MLIDSNAYVGSWPFMQLRHNNPEGLLRRMYEFGTDVSVISNLNGVFYKNTQNANEELFKWLNSNRIYKNKFIPLAVINPRYGGWKGDLKTCIHKIGVKGVRLYPKYHGYELADPACIELIKMCRDNGIPIVFSMRMVDHRPTSWMDINVEWALKDVITVIRNVPDAKYMFVNNSNSGPKLDQEEIVLLRNTDLLLDTSGRNMNNLSELINQFGIEKFCFGTHSPVLDYFTGLLRIEALREEELDSINKEKIRSLNILKMLGL